MASLKYLADMYVHFENEVETQESWMECNGVIVDEGGIEHENEEGQKELEQLRYKRDTAKAALVQFVVSNAGELL